MQDNGVYGRIKTLMTIVSCYQVGGRDGFLLSEEDKEGGGQGCAGEAGGRVCSGIVTATGM